MTKLRSPAEIRQSYFGPTWYSYGPTCEVIASVQRETLEAVAAMLEAMADDQHTMALVIAAEKVRAMIEETEK